MTQQNSQEQNRTGGSLLGRAILRDSEQAFNDAVAAGVLSVDIALQDYQTSGTSQYAGNWMYMYTLDGFDYFKNIAQRHYITSKVPSESEAGPDA